MNLAAIWKLPVVFVAENNGFAEPPVSLLVMGASRFSLEWAGLFAAAGSRVTVAVPGQRILPDEDADLAGFPQLALEERGVAFVADALAARPRWLSNRARVQGEAAGANALGGSVAR